MAVYKVIQDIEAEDKLLGWMTLKQFIAFCVSGASLYIVVMIAIGKIPPILLPVVVPVALISGLFAAPISRLQPTEVWLAARLRFMFKPRRRIWNQSGVQELVTITVPKHEAHTYQNNLSQVEVESRLSALAHTLDSRGWAIKNINVSVPVNNVAYSSGYRESDRLVSMSSVTDEVPNISVTASDDIMDPFNNAVAQRFDQQMKATSQRIHDDAVAHMQATMLPSVPVSQAPLPVDIPPQIPPTTPHIRVVSPLSPPPVSHKHPQTDTPKKMPSVHHKEPNHKAAVHAHPVHSTPNHTQKMSPKTASTTVVDDSPVNVTSQTNPAILELAHNNDFSVATIAQQANRKNGDNQEVTIKLR